jgi:hypothetical protein
MDTYGHLMSAPHSRATVDVITDEGIPLVADGGLAALTITAIAARSRCSRQAVQQWCAGTSIRTLFAQRFVARWRHWSRIRAREGADLTGLLPEDDQVLAWTRVWLALLEHGAREDAVRQAVEATLGDELRLVTAAVGPERAPAVHALVMGLRQARCLPGAALSAEVAQEALRAFVDGA